MLVLPGDKMFQSQYVVGGKSRPVILHGYGGYESWTDFPSQTRLATPCTQRGPPLWANDDWRPILGTSVDVKMLPEPLSGREEQLLLSRWARIPMKNLSILHAAHTWLHRKRDLPIEASPECPDSNPEHTHMDSELAKYLAPLFQPIKPSLEAEVLLTLRVMADTMSLDALRKLNSILLGGRYSHVNRTHWLEVVQDSFNRTGTPVKVGSVAHLKLLCDLVANVPYKLQVALGNGQTLLDQDIFACATGARPFPADELYVLVLPETGLCAPVTAARSLAIDCTGLGEHDLGGPPFGTDKHGQSIYGPSVACLESFRYENQNCIHVVALGWTKAMHEFLVLHYLATDSAQGWENFLEQCIPGGTWFPAILRRATPMNMFDKCHIAPSYRRMAHQSWASSMNLLLDLLCGHGKHRYMRTVTLPEF